MDPGPRVVLDTDVLIDFFSGVPPPAEVVERLLREDRAVVTTLTLFELACGARTEKQPRDIELLMEGVEILELGVPAALRAAAVRRELRARGGLLDPPDGLIAGCCLAAGLPLLTRNRRHFGRVPGLGLADPGCPAPHDGG